MEETATLTRPAKVKKLPLFKVILHNDDKNDAVQVAQRILQFVPPLTPDEAAEKTREAHENGQSILIATHKERAELIQDQFQSCTPPITVTIEADN